jgi:predicted HicB family RNase H-like nuclease
MKYFNLRLPDELHARLALAAEEDHRSIHGEILWLIERALAAR